jgi:hypothetical protein
VGRPARRRPALRGAACRDASHRRRPAGRVAMAAAHQTSRWRGSLVPDRGSPRRGDRCRAAVVTARSICYPTDLGRVPLPRRVSSDCRGRRARPGRRAVPALDLGIRCLGSRGSPCLAERTTPNTASPTTTSVRCCWRSIEVLARSSGAGRGRVAGIEPGAHGPQRTAQLGRPGLSPTSAAPVDPALEPDRALTATGRLWLLLRRRFRALRQVRPAW